MGKHNFFYNTKQILEEIWKNKERMIRISRYEYSLANKDSYLGKVWDILNPLIQIGTYWFVFGVGIRNNSPVGEHPFLVWMLCGLIPWFFFNQGLVKGSNSIFAKSGTVFRLKYPVSTIPLGTILTCLYKHVIELCLFVVILIAFGYYPNLYWINIIYYMFYTISFLVSATMITSVLTMIARDFQKLLVSVMRFWFYLSPVFWNMDKLPIWVKMLLELNPAYYIINGFRESLLYEKMFYESENNGLYYWALNIVLFTVGCNLQAKFRRNFADMI